jgi:hypothetical protein
MVTQLPPADEGLASQCQAAAQGADQNVNPNQNTRQKASKVSLPKSLFVLKRVCYSLFCRGSNCYKVLISFEFK